MNGLSVWNVLDENIATQLIQLKPNRSWLAGLEHWETMADNNDKKTGIEIVDDDNNNDDEDEFAHLEFQRQKWCSFFAKMP